MVGNSSNFPKNQWPVRCSRGGRGGGGRRRGHSAWSSASNRRTRMQSDSATPHAGRPPAPDTAADATPATESAPFADSMTAADSGPGGLPYHAVPARAHEGRDRGCYSSRLEILYESHACIRAHAQEPVRHTFQSLLWKGMTHIHEYYGTPRER